MRKTKLMALLLAALMVVAVFAGCAGDETDAPVTDAPVTDAPATDAPETDAPETDAPETDAPETDAPETDAPETDAPETDAPETDDPKAEGPETDAPETEAPETDAPETDAPETDAPETEAPETDAPVTEAPETDAPVTEAPETDAPVTEAPETEGPKPTEPTATVKAAAQAAQAEIEVQKGLYSKDASEYTVADYAKILEAFGIANVSINAATTVAEVEAAKAALNAELAKYMTFAEKAYDYYTKLLGNITEDAEALVDEAKAFLKELKKNYDDKSVEFVGKLDGVSKTTAPEWIAEVAYLVSTGSTEARDEYIDVYTNIETLITIFNGTSKDITKTNNKVSYVNEKGKVDIYEFATLAAYTKAAEDLVDDIDDIIGDELVFTADLLDDDNDFSKLFDRYDEYVEGAAALGGDALVDLITNADVLLDAEADYDNLVEAVKAYDEATVVSRTVKKDVFYYYTELKDKVALEYTDADGELAWVKDVYADVDAILADWVEEYDLSEENMLAIIEYKEGANFYTDTNTKATKTGTYVYNRHYNALLQAACDTFADEIADRILDLNAITSTSVEAVLEYNDIEEAIEDLLVLQEADKKAAYPENLAIELTAFDADDWKVILRESGIYEDLADERIEAYAEIIDLYTFDADIDELDDQDMIYFGYDDNDKLVNNRDNELCEIYNFFKVTYAKIEAAAESINDKIEALVEKVEDNKIASNEEFIALAGDYVKLTGAMKYESEDRIFTAADNCYVAVADLYTGDKYDDYMDSLAADASIAAFLYNYAEFEDMIDLADFKAAEKTLNDRIDDLFAQTQEIIDLVEAIGYVRADGAVIYKDLNKNGKYDKDEEVGVDQTITALVSLSDAAAVQAALDVYTAWVYDGGSLNISYFAALVDDEDFEYDDVFEMVGLNNASEIKSALETLETLDAAIQNLEKQADRFVAAVNNAIAVNKATPIIVTVDDNYLNRGTSNGSVKWWSWTKRTLSTADDARDNEGSYTYVNKNAVWELVTLNSYASADKGDPYGFLAKRTVDKATLLKTIAAMYEEFVAANVEYKADKDNDYKDGDVFYYQVSEYEAYKAFDDAVDSYKALDLLSAKGYVLAAIGAGTNDSFRAQIANAATIEAVENAIYNYNVNAASKIFADDINAYTVYDFDRLPVKELV